MSLLFQSHSNVLATSSHRDDCEPVAPREVYLAAIDDITRRIVVANPRLSAADRARIRR